MTEAKHTPGPWTVTGQKEYAYQIGIGVVTDRGIDPIAAAYGDGEAAKANAQLIAAAPDLLAACQQMLSMTVARVPLTSPLRKAACARARAAIAKAKDE